MQKFEKKNVWDGLGGQLKPKSTLAGAEGERSTARQGMRGESDADKVGKTPDPPVITRRYGRT